MAYKDQVCVITGAGGGIGRALAIELARSGAHLALSDINIQGLEETKAALQPFGAKVHIQKLDVADKAAIYAYADEVFRHFGVIHQLYNNAGVSGIGPLMEMTDEAIQRVIDINLMGVLHGSRAFMPHLLASGAGKLINISSLNGFAGMPGISIYCTSKFGVRGLTEALRAEALLFEQPLQVVCVHPGGIKTGIAAANRDDLADMPADARALRHKQLDYYEEKLLTYPADKAARDILRGTARGKHRIVITWQAKLLDRLTRLFPEGYLTLLNKRLQRDLA